MGIYTKAAILAKIETTKNEDSVPTGTANALLANDPQYSIEKNDLERNYVSNDLSPKASTVGRKLSVISFSLEVKGNGLSHSGNLGDASTLAALIQASGYKMDSVSGLNQILDAIPNTENSVPVAWVATASPTLTEPTVYSLIVTGTDEVTITGNNDDHDDLSTPSVVGTLISGTTEVSLGAKGGGITGTFASPLNIGDTFTVMVMPVGIGLTPTSTEVDQKTVTIYAFFDGKFHKITGGMGTFTIQAEAGGYATIDFTFTGQYFVPIDQDAPAVITYEDTVPPQVELSNLTWGSNNSLVAASWSYAQANSIVPRLDVNGRDGYASVRLTERAPTGSFDPEDVAASVANMWKDMADGSLTSFITQVGQVQGNRVVLAAPRVQISEVGYGNRDNIRTTDISMRFTRLNGDDEVRFFFN